jgi:gluconate:H+ symporter, GntP family
LIYKQLLILLCGIVAIVALTTRAKIHPFFALCIVSVLIGIASGIDLLSVIGTMKDGFGHIMKSLGFIIVLGTTLGLLLQRTGSTSTLAAFILEKVGEKRAPLAMCITGFAVGLPIFCDSGFIVLSGLNKSVARKTGAGIALMAGSLATGLYAVHCLLPPHPGASAATALLGSDYGSVILFGLLVALPSTLAGFAWVKWMAAKTNPISHDNDEEPNVQDNNKSVVMSALPIVVPILLIATSAYFKAPDKGFLRSELLPVLGEPVVALSIGILLSLLNLTSRAMAEGMLRSAVEKSGEILVIIGAGGAFGAVLASTRIGETLGEALPLETLGIFFPFLVTVILKTAQGSSTVAIITASSIVFPLLDPLGLDSEDGKILAILSMGAGSMMVSHANDAYFWVIANFQKVPLNSMLKVYTPATVVMGVSAMVAVYLLSIFMF